MHFPLWADTGSDLARVIIFLPTNATATKYTRQKVQIHGNKGAIYKMQLAWKLSKKNTSGLVSMQNNSQDIG